MKKAIVTLFMGLGIMVNASQEWRTFTSSDGTQTFKGKLIAFDKESETVTAFHSKRQRASFKMDMISEDDQAYVNENADKLPPDVNLQIGFDKLYDRKSSRRGNGTQTRIYDGGFTISVNSYTPRAISEAVVEYVMIYRKDRVDGKYSDVIVKESKTVAVPPNKSASVATKTVGLVSFYKAGNVTVIRSSCSGGSCGKGSVRATKSQRSRDTLVGCVARVTVNGHVVSVSATSPRILEKYESELDSSQ